MSDINDFNQGVIAESATVVEAEGVERQRLFDAQVAIMPFFADYQLKAGARVIPVLRLVRD